MSVPLSDQPRELIPGLKAWRNHNGYTSVLLHHTADPDTATPQERRLSVPDEARYKREHELDFSTWAGKAVYPAFDEKLHVDENIGFMPELPVWVGWDFGYHHPVAIFAHVGTEVWVFGEVMGEDVTLEQFLARNYYPYRDKILPDSVKYLHAADPAGKQVSDKSEHTSFSILSNHGIFPVQRKTEISEGLTIIRQRLELGLFKFHPRCRMLIEAFRGGYRYPDPTPGIPEPKFPAKDGYYEHPCDALRYLCVNSISLIAPKPREEEPEPSWVQKIVNPKPVDDLYLLSD